MEIDIIRSKRKTIAIQITEDSRILVRAPICLTDDKIADYVASKSNWISKTRNRLKSQISSSMQPYSAEELQEYKKRAAEDIGKRVDFWAPIIGVRYHSVSYGFQVSKWGSCSSHGNLRFNTLLVCTPTDVRDYLVVHELCHLKHMNHSKAFWNEVYKFLPNYKKSQLWLKDHGTAIITRLRKTKKQESLI